MELATSETPDTLTLEATSLPAILACLKAHLDAENAHDIDAIMDTCCESPQVAMNGLVFAGTDGVRGFYERFGFGDGGAFSELRVTERHRHIHGRVVVLEQSLAGVHTGRWHGHQPTGLRFHVPVCTVHTFSARAKLAREDLYFDSYQLQLQLGLRSAV